MITNVNTNATKRNNNNDTIEVLHTDGNTDSCIVITPEKRKKNDVDLNSSLTPPSIYKPSVRQPSKKRKVLTSVQ